MKKSLQKNQVFSSPNHLNRRLYKLGLDGGLFGNLVFLILGVSFFVSLVIGELILLLPIAILLGMVMSYLLKPYAKRLREDKIDDPFLRDQEVGKFCTRYRDDDGFLNKL